MGKKRNLAFQNLLNTPFQSPRASPKHTNYQINGETQQSQTNRIMQVLKRKSGK